MSFINAILLAGLGAVAIPVIIHLLSRKAARVIDWGAMQFLLDSVESRKRRIQLEEALLMASRCLLMGLLALAVARPFAPPGSQIPWVIVLPAFLLALVAFTTSIVLRGNRRWFWILMILSLLLAGASVAAVYFERLWNLKRFGTAGGKDIAIIIDSSTSMQLRAGGGAAGSNFDAAVAAAKAIVEQAPGGTAFSVILGGPVPMVRIPEPVVNKPDIQEVLGNAAPVQGRMAAFDALATAAVSLSRGGNPNKEIIVLTDGQNMGWDVDNRARWEALVSGMETLPSKPRVLMQKFPLPAQFRNAAVAGISYSREVIGTDRAVSIDVTVENTGTEAITPGGVELRIGEEVLRDPGTGQLQPGARGTVRFVHQFKTPGSAVVTASVKTNDDLPLDDESVSVCHVVNRLGVLIVDGNPSERFFDRAGAFTALALAPASLPGPAHRKEKEKPAVALDPEVVPLSRVSSLTSFQSYDVIVLADVAKLPDSTARRISSWVQSGGGLLVLPGVQALPDFYNNWRDTAGDGFLPARMTAESLLKEPAGISLATFSHPALKMVADAKQSDLGGTLLQRYWRLEPNAAGGGSAGGRLVNGDAFLTSAKSGFGGVVVVCCNFDTASGNLPSRQAFVALVHQLVYYLANPEGQPLNRQPAAQVTLPLKRASVEGGLRGEYFKGRGGHEPVLVRIDPRPDFQWGGGRPAPPVPKDFTARWTGAIIPRYTEEYLFDGWGDDALNLSIDGKVIFESGGEGSVRLEAGRYYPIELNFVDESGGAALQLNWRSRSQPREVIPPECLIPFPPDAGETESVVGKLEASGPDGRNRAVDLVFTRGGLSARIGQDIVPGLYRIQLPPEQKKEYAALTAADGTIPFTVAGDVAESRLTGLGKEELDFMRQRVELLEPGNTQEMLDILAGREFGEELWKYLATGALFLLLAEIALTRWIAISRRSGEADAINFETKFEPSQQFREALREVREGNAG